MAEASTSHVRHSRRKPFSTWMKRLTNLKGSSSDSQPGRSLGKRNNGLNLKGKRQNSSKNNPYPLSGIVRDGTESPHRSYNDTVSYAESTEQHRNHLSSQQSLRASTSEPNIPGNSDKSTAPTLSTNGDTARSEAGYSKAGTTMTGRGGIYGGGEGSTFSSPASSVRSLTTTLTTVQSAAPSAQIYGIPQNNQPTSAGLMNSAQNNSNQQVQFSHQFPSSPASAVPPHIATTGHPTTYSSATANNLLTDNASILTLASSSKRRRRNSLDTNASVRALAPSSVFGGSRESLPLSVLSANVNVDASNASITNAPGVLNRQSLGGLASAERISVYSTSGVAPLAHGGERSSLIASKQGDNGSVRSGTQSHTRNDSAAGSVTGTIGSTLNNNAITSSATPGRISRRSSGWGEISGEGTEEENRAQQVRESESGHQEDEGSEKHHQEDSQGPSGDPGPSTDESLNREQ